jgi:hypothetical protein
MLGFQAQFMSQGAVWPWEILSPSLGLRRTTQSLSQMSSKNPLSPGTQVKPESEVGAVPGKGIGTCAHVCELFVYVSTDVSVCMWNLWTCL